MLQPGGKLALKSGQTMLRDTLFRHARTEGIQVLQRRGEAGARELSTRRISLAPGGSAAPPGYRLYHLWGMAGEQRRLALHEDPAHAWIHDAG